MLYSRRLLRGGEEFLLVFAGCGLEQGLRLAERCRQAVQSKPHDKVGVTTVSIGVGELQNNEALANLIERVDQALYRAKNLGRNRTEISVNQS